MQDGATLSSDKLAQYHKKSISKTIITSIGTASYKWEGRDQICIICKKLSGHLDIEIKNDWVFKRGTKKSSEQSKCGKLLGLRSVRKIKIKARSRVNDV